MTRWEEKIFPFLHNQVRENPNLSTSALLETLPASCQAARIKQNTNPHPNTLMSLTLATFAVKSANIGFKTFMLTNLLAADAGFNSAFGSVLYILNLVGLTLAFGGLLFAAVMFMMGQTERMIYGLVGAVIGGMSWLIVKTMFGQTGANVEIDMGSAIN